MRVSIEVPAGDALLATAWWPKGVVTGTVTKTYKNGNAMVSIDQMPNRSQDGRRSMLLPLSWLTEAR